MIEITKIEQLEAKHATATRAHSAFGSSDN
jgi:hypothetical protein